MVTFVGQGGLWQRLFKRHSDDEFWRRLFGLLDDGRDVELGTCRQRVTSFCSDGVEYRSCIRSFAAGRRPWSTRRW